VKVDSVTVNHWLLIYLSESPAKRCQCKVCQVKKVVDIDKHVLEKQRKSLLFSCCWHS